jgi:MarR family transcriptional regulator, organic hydroperoxide resistance regulator
MFDGCIYFSLNSTFRKVERLWESAFKRTGLSPSHGYLLHLILTKPGLTQAQLGEVLQVERSTMTRFLEALEKKRYLKRSTSANDARAIEVYPTEKAKALWPEIKAVLASVSRPVCDSVSEKKMEQLLGLLQEVRTHLK